MSLAACSRSLVLPSEVVHERGRHREQTLRDNRRRRARPDAVGRCPGIRSAPRPWRVHEFGRASAGSGGASGDRFTLALCDELEELPCVLDIILRAPPEQRRHLPRPGGDARATSGQCALRPQLPMGSAGLNVRPSPRGAPDGAACARSRVRRCRGPRTQTAAHRCPDHSEQPTAPPRSRLAVDRDGHRGHPPRPRCIPSTHRDRSTLRSSSPTLNRARNASEPAARTQPGSGCGLSRIILRRAMSPGARKRTVSPGDRAWL